MHFNAFELDRLAADLGHAPAKVETGGRVVVSKTTAATERSAKAFCPVGEGDLRDSIRSVTDGLEGEVIAGTDHAEYVEDGTSHMAPQPFMTPALRAHEVEFVAGFSTLAGNIL